MSNHRVLPELPRGYSWYIDLTSTKLSVIVAIVVAEEKVDSIIEPIGFDWSQCDFDDVISQAMGDLYNRFMRTYRNENWIKSWKQ